jgi:hypothetical protein
VAKVLRRNNGLPAGTRAVTYLKAADFATGDKADVPYGPDALKEQQLSKLAKVAKKAAEKAAKVAKTAAKKAMGGGCEEGGEGGGGSEKSGEEGNGGCEEGGHILYVQSFPPRVRRQEEMRFLQQQVQGCEQGQVRARAPEGLLQGLRHRLLPARAW